MEKIENFKEAKELIARYRSITLEEIEDVREKEGEWTIVANVLTGYGTSCTCTLCSVVDRDCSKCLYRSEISFGFFCIKGENKKTYNAICMASNSQELLEAFRNRADHIEKLIEKLQNNI